MDKNILYFDSDACLQFIHSKFNYYTKFLDEDQQACNKLIATLRQHISLYNNDDEKLRSITGFNRIELVHQLDYFEQEAFKTNEENKACLLKMFQNLFNLHRQSAFQQVLIYEQKIEKLFQYRPSVLANVKKLHFPEHASMTSTITTKSSITTEKTQLTYNPSSPPDTSLTQPIRSTSFSNRADVETFQQRKISTPSTITIESTNSPFLSNEVNLTQLVRETSCNNTSDKSTFSNLSYRLRQQSKSSTIPLRKISRQSVSCDGALLAAVSKRHVLLYNMNVANILYIYDMQDNDIKEIKWDEGHILSFGHVDSNTFYLITSTKAFTYDIIKEKIEEQYFLYNTLYKDLLLISEDPFYKTILKRNNQIPSMVFDDYCYYLYTNTEYNHIFIKCTLQYFSEEQTINLTKLFPDIQYFIDFTVTNKSLVTYLVYSSNAYQLLICDESQDNKEMKRIPLVDSLCPTKIISTFLPKLKYSSTSANNKKKSIKYGKQLWFILDVQKNCIDCVTHEVYVMKIKPKKSNQIQSISLHNDQLILAYNESSVEIIDLDNYFSSIQL